MPPTATASTTSQRWLPRIIWALSGLNLVTVGSVLFLVLIISERWWVGTVLTYLPRSPWGLPSLLLIPLALKWHRPSLWANLLALLLVAGPLMDFRSPWLAEELPKPASRQSSPQVLRIVSANVQGYKPDFTSVLSEISQFEPDVVVLQEARGEHALLQDFFPEWHRLHIDYYWVGSRYPIRLKHECQTVAFDRTAGLIVELDLPSGPIALADIHQMTARRGLQDLSTSELATGSAQASLEEFQLLRLAESSELREQIRQHAGDLALIVAGDFNTPSSSSLFSRTWGDLISAFDVAGTGYGYTSPVKPQRYWVSYLPWARIDHVLCSSGWQILRCQVGQSRGSDHHVIFAEISR